MPFSTSNPFWPAPAAIAWLRCHDLVMVARCADDHDGTLYMVEATARAMDGTPLAERHSRQDALDRLATLLTSGEVRVRARPFRRVADIEGGAVKITDDPRDLDRRDFPGMRVENDTLGDGSLVLVHDDCGVSRGSIPGSLRGFKDIMVDRVDFQTLDPPDETPLQWLARQLPAMVEKDGEAGLPELFAYLLTRDGMPASDDEVGARWAAVTRDLASRLGSANPTVHGFKPGKPSFTIPGDWFRRAVFCEPWGPRELELIFEPRRRPVVVISSNWIEYPDEGNIGHVKELGVDRAAVLAHWPRPTRRGRAPTVTAKQKSDAIRKLSPLVTVNPEMTVAEGKRVTDWKGGEKPFQEIMREARKQAGLAPNGKLGRRRVARS